jgi:hypothetical protein
MLELPQEQQGLRAGPHPIFGPAVTYIGDEAECSSARQAGIEEEESAQMGTPGKYQGSKQHTNQVENHHTAEASQAGETQ